MTRYVRGDGETLWHVAEPWQERAAEVQCGASPDRNVWSEATDGPLERTERVCLACVEVLADYHRNRGLEDQRASLADRR